MMVTGDFEVADPVKIESLKARIEQLEQAERELIEQQNAAMRYMTAVVAHAVGVGVTFGVSNADMNATAGLVLEVGDLADGGLALRVRNPNPEPMPEKPQPLILEHQPVLAKAERPIILLDPNRPPNE